MQTKIYNAYRITHKNGSIEDINALDLVQALENMETPETESRVQQAFLVKENVKTLVEDRPEEIMFSSVVAEGGLGSIATPTQGVLHVGDKISLKAVPAKNYAFLDWKMNGEIVGTDADILYTIPELGEGINTIVFTATFGLSDINWKSEVSPSEASGAGCVAFPLSGTVKANGSLSLIAVAEQGYTFDHWERNGQNIGTNKILNTEVEPLSENETSCVYKAVFTAN